jgi:hypothetical protein
MKGNRTLGNKCNIKCLKHTLSTNYNGKLFFIIKRPRSYKMSFCYTSSLLKGLLIAKKVDIALIGTINLFFANYLPIILTISLLISSSIFFTIIE